MQETKKYFFADTFDNIYLHVKLNRAVRNFDSSSQRKKKKKNFAICKICLLNVTVL